ncbi:FMN reductase [Thermobifida cellulosilytica]|uniref:NADPH-dependent FMN reductase n=1 Tax=Thermobifida cellulosilytica TB100 TaxID=665004 RepID=A0A147KK27_THECS|nr:FMN reductase [Thermobifida cellulosilytica]KUP97670.1 NADPH-dependent FMN reductase [Thermobifida cellulosilytica TB100]
MTARTLTVVSAGLGRPSSTRLLADRLAEAARRSLEARGTTADTLVVELRDHAHHLTNALLTGVPTGGLHEVLERVADSDGLIAVTPVFAASYSGLFKTFFDVLDPDALAGTPVLLGATGGTPRHSLVLDHALRPLFAHLRALAAPTGVYAASQDWGDDGEGVLAERIDRAAGEFAALVAARAPKRRIDPYEAPTPFEELLPDR